MSREMALSELTSAALATARKYGLGYMGAIDMVAKVLAAMTEAAYNASLDRPIVGGLKCVEAATRSTHNMSTIKLEVGRAIFDTATGLYWHVDSDGVGNPCPLDSAAAPEIGWEPLLNPDAAELIHKTPAPKEPTMREAAENSAFRVSWILLPNGDHVYWVWLNGKYIWMTQKDTYIHNQRLDEWPERGWKPVENSDTASRVTAIAKRS